MYVLMFSETIARESGIREDTEFKGMSSEEVTAKRVEIAGVIEKLI